MQIWLTALLYQFLQALSEVPCAHHLILSLYISMHADTSIFMLLHTLTTYSGDN